MPAYSGTYIGVFSQSASCANVFTAASSEILKAVSVRSSAYSSEMNIKIYLLGGTDAPDAETLVYNSDMYFQFGGYHTVLLDKDIALSPGQRFSIVTTEKLDENGSPVYAYNINTAPSYDTATDPKSTSNIYGVARIGEGESFMNSGTGWSDISEQGMYEALAERVPGQVFDNFSIKAFTVLA
jgi:hypothetical protein